MVDPRHAQIVLILKAMELDAYAAHASGASLIRVGLLDDPASFALWTDVDKDRQPCPWRYSVYRDGEITRWGTEVIPHDASVEDIARIVSFWDYSHPQPVEETPMTDTAPEDDSETLQSPQDSAEATVIQISAEGVSTFTEVQPEVPEAPAGD